MEFITTESLRQLMELSVASLVLITVIIGLVVVALIIRQRAPIEKSHSDADVAQAKAQGMMAQALTKTSEAQLKSAEAMMTNAQTQRDIVTILSRVDERGIELMKGMRVMNAKLDYLRVVAERNSNGNGGKLNGVSGHPSH